MIASMKPFVLLLVIALCSPFISWAQDEDPVLFSVDGKPVHESEFFTSILKQMVSKLIFLANPCRSILICMSSSS
jgi:hypothetical protein